MDIDKELDKRLEERGNRSRAQMAAMFAKMKGLGDRGEYRSGRGNVSADRRLMRRMTHHNTDGANSKTVKNHADKKAYSRFRKLRRFGRTKAGKKAYGFD